MASASQQLPNLKPEPPRINAFDALAERCVRAGMTLTETRVSMQAAYIRAQLNQHKWNQCRAAKASGVHRNTLSRQIDNLQLDAELRDVKMQRKNKRRGR